MSKDEALKMALDWYDSGREDRDEFESMMKVLLAEQAAGQQEPVANLTIEDGRVAVAARILPDGVYDLYTSPPASKPLTDAQIGVVAAEIWGSVLIAPQSYQAFARAIEAAHGIKENKND